MLLLHRTGLLGVLQMTHLSWRPAAREEVPIVIAMERDIKNTGVIVEHFLGAVTMVNILATG